MGTLVIRRTGSSLLVVGEGDGGGGLLVAPVEERWLRIWVTTLARLSRRLCVKRSSGWCVSEGVKCGGGLSGRKYVSVAEICSVEGDRVA